MENERFKIGQNPAAKRLIDKYKSWNDRKLVTQIKTLGENSPAAKEYMDALYFRYNALVEKNWIVLLRQMNFSDIIQEQETDFHSEAYETFRKALKSIKIAAIRDDKWLFVGWYRNYLKNLRAKYISEARNKCNKETSLYYKSEDGKEGLKTDLVDDLNNNKNYNPAALYEEKEYMEEIRGAFAACMPWWNDTCQKVAHCMLTMPTANKAQIARAIGTKGTIVSRYVDQIGKDVKEYLNRPNPYSNTVYSTRGWN